jgi:hypothetical protein
VTRTQLDAANPASIPRLDTYDGMLVAGYLTGSPGTWWQGHWHQFPGAVMVAIDQHGFGEHDYAANVMDVETDCWSVQDIIKWTSECTAPRPTVYCDRDDYPLVRAVWNGDVWLAAPGGVNPADYPGVVAVQDLYLGNYDSSIVYDDYWPLRAPVSGDINITVSGDIAILSWSRVNGAAEYAVSVETLSSVIVSASKVTATTCQVKLAPGTYNFRVTPVYPDALPMTVNGIPVS